MKMYFVLAAILIAFIAGAAGGYYFEKSGIPALISDQKKVDTDLCNKTQTVTKESNDALQKNDIAIASKLDADKLQHPNACIGVAGTAPVPTGRAKHARPNGSAISTDWLRSYAAQCETYRGEVGVCVSFLADERKLIQPDAQ